MEQNAIIDTNTKINNNNANTLMFQMLKFACKCNKAGLIGLYSTDLQSIFAQWIVVPSSLVLFYEITQAARDL